MSEIPFTGLGSDFLLPGGYAEAQFGVGAASTNAPGRGIGLVMPMLNSGNWTATTAYNPTSLAEVASGAGDGSPLYRAYAKASAAYPDGDIWCIPVEATSAGAPVAATWSATLTTDATAPGQVQIDIAGEQTIVVSFASGATVTEIGDLCTLSVNHRTHLPVTMSNVAGALTVTAKLEGASQGDGTVGVIQVRVVVPPGSGTTVETISGDALGLGTGTAGADGTTTEAANLTAALAAINSLEYYYLGISDYSAAALSALALHVDTKAEPRQGKRGTGVWGYTGAAAAGIALSVGENRSRGWPIIMPSASSDIAEMVGNYCAILCKRQNPSGGDPAVNLDSYSDSDWLINPPYDSEDYISETVANDCLVGGLNPVMSTRNGTALTMAVTSRSKDNTGVYNDFRSLEAHRVSTVDERLSALLATNARQNSGMKLVADDTLADGSVNPNQVLPPNTTSPAQLRRMCVANLQEGGERGLLQAIETSSDATRVQMSSLGKGRVTAQIPYRTIDHLHQFAVLGQEVSPG